MKIRIKMPDECVRGYGYVVASIVDKFVDDILFWGMETEMDIELYSTVIVNRDDEGNYQAPVGYAIFSVEERSAMMFSLKWGALRHKKSKKPEC